MNRESLVSDGSASCEDEPSLEAASPDDSSLKEKDEEDSLEGVSDSSLIVRPHEATELDSLDESTLDGSELNEFDEELTDVWEEEEEEMEEGAEEPPQEESKRSKDNGASNL